MLSLTAQSLAHIAHKIHPEGKLLRLWKLGGGISAEMTAFEIEVYGITHKYILRLPGLKALELRSNITEIEFKTLHLAQALGLPSPIPLLMDESKEIVERPYLILEFIEGQPLFSLAGTDAAVNQMGAALAAIHQADISPFDTTFLPRFSELDCPMDQPPSDLLSAADLDRVRAAMRLAPPTYRNPTTLLHCDFWPGNLLWHNGKLIAIIDWEDACLGDPLVDFAGCRMEIAWLLGMDDFSEFSKQYIWLNPINTTDLPFYDLCVALRLARLFYNDLTHWAEYFIPLGRTDLTPKTIHKIFHRFIEQALTKILN